MKCANCGKEIAEYSNFCYYCGSRQYAGAAGAPGAAPAGGAGYAGPAGSGVGARRLYRSRTDRSIAGVLGGFAEYLDVDPSVLRVVYVLVTFFTGLIPGTIAYLVAWMVMSEAPSGAEAAYAYATVARAPAPAGQARRLMRSVRDRKWAGVCGGIAEYLGVDSTVIRIIWVVLSIVPGSIIGGLLVYLLAWMVMPQGQAPATAPQGAGQPVAHSS